MMDFDFHVRYFLEHEMLPRSLYNEGARFLNSFMLHDGSAMSSFYDKVAAANPDYICPYDSTDFHVHYRTYIHEQDSCLVLRVEMPEPERPLLCRAIYLCYGTRGGYELYVTSEFAEDGSYYICAWGDQGLHFNFGVAPEDANEEMDMAADLFWRSIVDGRKIKPEGLCCS